MFYSSIEQDRVSSKPPQPQLQPQKQPQPQLQPQKQPQKQPQTGKYYNKWWLKAYHFQMTYCDYISFVGNGIVSMCSLLKHYAWIRIQILCNYFKNQFSDVRNCELHNYYCQTSITICCIIIAKLYCKTTINR